MRKIKYILVEYLLADWEKGKYSDLQFLYLLIGILDSKQDSEKIIEA